MPPRAPVIWASTGVGAERFRKRIDERHRELSVQAKLRGRSYRRSRAEAASQEGRRLRGEFLAALGRLSSFETSSLRIMRCRYQVQLNERGAERFDFFATQLGRLEGMADALILAGRNVRLFPLPPLPWVAAEQAAASY